MCPGLGVGQQDPSPRATGQSQGAESRTGGSLVLGRGTEGPEHESGGQQGVVALSTL